ncbi:competence protein CoiA family protein [Prescottella subtropica]|uniref:competence protein CoiA family protein n=1 Tax=Prescottella subtropica TaxID=2545757 RepID=UPI001386FA46|nr:competence protein CoiA family protein [Prescottella subtropica]
MTGEPVFIDNGTAAAVRDLARTSWSCLVPGCATPISTRGGSKRDHFFHLGNYHHAATPESQNHLAAKAMLAQWAAGQTVDRAVVVEEHAVKNRDTNLDRRPDVLVTRNSDSHRLALEVEYKQFPVESWQRKQQDFDDEGIACTWLLGHTRIRPVSRSDDADDTRGVTVPLLAKRIAAVHRHVLVVNPVTREIGTLAGDPDLTTPIGRYGTVTYLGVDSLAACSLHPVRGVGHPHDAAHR